MPRTASGTWATTTAPVSATLARFSTTVSTLKSITVSSFPQTISLRRAGLQSRVSSVPRSFSPAQRSIAG